MVTSYPRKTHSRRRHLFLLWSGLTTISVVLVGATGCNGGTARHDVDNRQSSEVSATSGSLNLDGASTPDQFREAYEKVESLSDLSVFSRGFDRSVALHNLLARANERQLVELIRQSKEIEQYSQRHNTRISIFQRFASLDPKAALTHIATMPRFERDGLIATTFSQWALEDLDKATAHAKSLEGFRKQAALRGILQSRDDLADEQLREIARQIGNEQLAIELIAQSKLAGSMESPEQAWNSLVNDDVGDASQTGLLIQVAEAWFDKSGLSVLDDINRSLLDWQTRQSILNAIVQRVVQSNPSEAFEYAKGMDDEGNNLLLIVARAWASLDPESALNAAQTIGAGLVRRNLEYSIVQVWASSDPHFILDNLDRLPEASRAVAQSQAIMAIARTSPEEASQLMAGMDDPTSRYSVAYAIVSNWVRTDVNAALDWVLNNGELKDLREQLLTLVLSRLARDDPEFAMQTALNQPIGRNGAGLEYTVLSYIASTDPQKALSMLPQVRDGQTSLWAHISVGGALVRAGQTDNALKLASNLDESEQERYYGNLVSTWASNDAKNLYDNIDRLPTAKARSSAALTLITWNSWQKSLSDDQIDRAKNYLTSDDAEAVEKGDATRGLGYRMAVEQGFVLPAPASSQ